MTRTAIFTLVLSLGLAMSVEPKTEMITAVSTGCVGTPLVYVLPIKYTVINGKKYWIKRPWLYQ